MSRIVVRPFEASDLPAAGRLLAERHARHRRTHPLLPADYEDAKLALVEVTAVWETEGASGSVAVDGNEVTGYVLAAPKPSAVWGPNIWVEAAGHAVRDPETIRDLYGAAATQWVEEGRTAHYVVVPSDAELIDGWFLH